MNCRKSALTLAALLALSASAAPAADILVNGGFDAGPGVGWTAEGGGFELIVPAEESVVAPLEGTHLAWLGGADNAIHRLWQDVAVPGGANRLTVRAWVWISSAEPFGGVTDVLAFELRTPGGDLLHVLAQRSNLDHAVEWVALTAQSPAAHAGESVRLEIRAETDAGVTTNFFVDSVVLDAETVTAAWDATWGSVKALYR